ncbi:MAG TPA: hypothetical protein VMT89_12015 [Candidatus Acidoferrales bacterium]|nr:hypothetical protein [Candidatus Acidoferrales bacterium]
MSKTRRLHVESKHAGRRLGLVRIVSAAALSLSVVHGAEGQTASSSLTNCQKAVKVETAKYLKKKQAAITACLQKVATRIVKSNLAIDNLSARLCVTQFRKLNDSRVVGASLIEKMTTNIKKKCEPGMPGVLHTFADIRGIMNTVPQPLKTTNIDTWCKRFGGDGSIDSVQEWINCLTQAHSCDADSGISVQYPRAIEWLGLVNTAIGALPPPPASDPNRNTDAATGVTNLKSELDGAVVDGLPDIECGVAPTPSCSTACCYQEFGLGSQVSCFQYTGTAAEVASFSAACNGKASTPPGAWSMTSSAGACGNPPDFPTHSACSSGGTPGSFVLIPQDSTCP